MSVEELVCSSLIENSEQFAAMMLNKKVENISGLQYALARTEDYLHKLQPDARLLSMEDSMLGLVEAMTCGLPTFATYHGGPVEFFEWTQKDNHYWTTISEPALRRICENYGLASNPVK